MVEYFNEGVVIPERKAFLFVIILLFILAAPIRSVKSPLSVPLKLKDYIQPNIFYCGPTAIYLLLEYWGMENIDFDELVDLMFSETMKGTSNSSMVFFPQRYGLRPYSFSGDFNILKKTLEQKIPVVVLQDLKKGFKLGHFRIVVGIDERDRSIIIKDPAKKGIQRMSLRKFQSLWERGDSINNRQWAMILVPEFFECGIKEIVDSPLTELNRGSFFYNRLEYMKAYLEFQKAFTKSPTHPDVLKYYAQVLIRLKNFSVALGIIEKLMTLSPGDAVVYDLKGLYHFYKGEFKKALDSLEEAKRMNSDPRKNQFIDIHYRMVKKFLKERKHN